MKQAKKDAKTKNAYKASTTLTNYLEEKLQLCKLEKESKEAGGKPLSIENEKKKELNSRKRVHVLNRHIFESMANLVTFFEFVSSDYGLLEEFENENRELLMGMKLSRKTKDGKYEADYLKDSPVFYRLIDSILSWDYDKSTHDFRIVLLNLTQWCVYHKVRNISYPVFGDRITDAIVQPDLLRSSAWTKALSERNDVDKWVEMEDHHRPVLF